MVSLAGGFATGAGTTYGAGKCALLAADWGICAGQYGCCGRQRLRNRPEKLRWRSRSAIDNNHALFVQDAWTVGHGLTLNLGLRIEKESLPAPPGIGIAGIRPSTSHGARRLNLVWELPGDRGTAR